MSFLLKIRSIFVLLLIGGVWYVYGENFKLSDFQSIYEEIHSDVNQIIENPEVQATVVTVGEQVQRWFDELKGKLEDNIETQPKAKKPDLEEPSKQSFSVHNIEIGDSRSEVEKQAGSAKRASLNEYGVEWVAYHDNYQNFFMAAYNEENKVAGLYTNQDLLASTLDITFKSSRESVRATASEPLESIQKGLVSYKVQNDQEYDTFLIDNNYVTIFYDKHEDNRVTAIQIISGELEQQKEKFFTDPSPELKEGFEYQLFDLTNAARVNHGLSVLDWDESVRETARGHSKDMAGNHYFSHTNLEGQSPFDRMAEDGIAFSMAGENLAMGQVSSIFAHEGLMNSPGHRENILQKNYERLGVGVAFNEKSQPFYTENFLKK
ncbi:CAP domain-containing protein [Pueribacillus theae]|uniref:CAP domain-containing protein n=1 Tax=Pueribacillus theae TaxID=2171751 RepID=UPI0030B83928